MHPALQARLEGLVHRFEEVERLLSDPRGDRRPEPLPRTFPGIRRDSAGGATGARLPAGTAGGSRRARHARRVRHRDAHHGAGRTGARRHPYRTAGKGHPAADCCRRTRATRATCSWKSAPAPAATRPRSSPATCSACTSATPRERGWQVEVVSHSPGEHGGYKEVIARIAGQGVYAQAQVRVRRASRAARAGHRGPGAHPHLGRAPWRCCPRPRRSTPSRSTRPISRSTPSAPAAPAASTSTRPTRRSASPICRPASWSSARTSARSTRTARAPCRSCRRAHAGGRNERKQREQEAAAPQEPGRHAATAPSASAPTISRRGASPTTAST